MPQVSDTRAQESSIQFSVGYGLPLGSEKISENSATNSGTTVTSGVFGSYGAGFTLNLGYTRMFSPFVGLDLTGSYLIGKYYSSTRLTIGGNTVQNDYSTSASGVLLSPTMILRAGNGKVRPYMRAGLQLAFVSLNEEYSGLVLASSGKQSANGKYTLTGGPTLGFRGGVGVDFSPSKDVAFFAEVVITSMSFQPSEGELTIMTINGADQINKLSVYDKKTVFVDEISSGSTPNTSQPRQQLQVSYPMSSLQLNAGVRMSLVRKTKGT